MTSRQAGWARKQHETGLCVSCTRPATHGRHCKRHHVLHLEYARRSYAKRKDEGRIAASFYLSRKARARLRRMTTRHGLTQSALIEKLILESYE